MNRHFFALLLILSFCKIAKAENWDYIKTSGEYYFGIGVAATEEEAEKAAMADLISQIATHVSSDFTQIDDVTTRNGNIDHNTQVLNCIQTYSQTTLTNVQKFEPDGKAPKIRVRMYLKKTELARIFDNRIAKAQNMLEIADDCLDNKKIDMALQYYYWAYSLVRSVQFPSEVKDENGRIIVDWIPVKINQILSDINVTFEKKDGDFIDLLFKYKDEPVSSLEFSYSDGRAICQGMAKDGRGTIEMLPGYETNTYHIDIEYEYKGLARGDAEIESVLRVITPKVFPKASMKVTSRNVKRTQSQSKTESNQPLLSNQEELNDNENINVIKHQPMKKTSTYAQSINDIIRAFRDKSYTDVNKYFTIDGLQMFNRLTGYGKARVLDYSKLRYYKGLNGRIIARGLKMSFSFNGKRKKTFVEDISFTFNKDYKIENVAFGLGDLTEYSIFNSKASWSDEVREIIVSFMENYKTAYSLERLDYIRNIFADDAVIIIGNVAKRYTTNPRYLDRNSISLNGQDVIKYNRYTKDNYIKNLERCFNRNDFINLKFTNQQIQWLEKFENQKIFAINIRQEYNSSTYADNGYLFLLVDMTNLDAPLIKVRTWQPNEVSIEKLYNAGDFFND